MRGRTDTSGFCMKGNRIPVGMIYALIIEHSPAVVATANPGKNPISITVIIAGKKAMVTLTIGSGIVPRSVNAIIIVMATIKPVIANVFVFSLFITLPLAIFSSLCLCYINALYYFTIENHKNQGATKD